MVTGKLQHVGRSGVPGTVRYAAHEDGLQPENLTQDVISAYVEYTNSKDTGNKSPQIYCWNGSKEIMYLHRYSDKPVVADALIFLSRKRWLFFHLFRGNLPKFGFQQVGGLDST